MNTGQQAELRKRKRVSFMLNCVVMVIVSLILAFYFGIRLYVGEVPPFLWAYKVVIIGMISPLQFVTQWIMPFFPPSFKSVFPEMPADLFLSSVLGQPVSSLSQYKGVVDWLTLLSIPAWQCFLILSYFCSWYLRESFSLTDVQEAVVSYQQSQNPKPRKIGVPVQEQQPRPPRQTTDAHIKDRLSDSKNLSQKAPEIQPAQKVTQQDWQSYKKNEGELIQRDMIRQLQQENHNLRNQKDELQSTFSQYFSPEVLKYLEKNKQAYEGLQNQQHSISVLFCDLRGFSKYSQDASSEEVLAYLGEYFEIASYCVLHKYNGVISKLMGDGFMAYWGFPMASKDHAYTATQAALTILREVQLRNELKPLQKPIEVGIGIATGTVMVGNIGSMDFKDFTLIGVPVNLAARLQETSKKLKTSLLISQNTYTELNGKLNCHNWGETEIRGWQNPETVYTPIVEE